MNSSDEQQNEMVIETISDETTVERFIPPRLSIALLLVWTAIAAVLLKLDMAIGHMQLMMGPQLNDVPKFARIIESSFWAISDMTLAAGLLGTGVIVVARIRGSKGRLQAGHWLMIAYTFGAVVLATMQHLSGLLVIVCGEYLFESPYLNVRTLIVATVFVVRLVGSAGIYFWGVFRCKGGRHWTVALCLLPVIVLIHAGLKPLLARLLSVQSLGEVFMILSHTRLVMPGLVVLGAVAVDLYKGRQRDWLHWTGVGIVVIPMLFAIGRLAIFLIFYNGV